MKTNRIEMVSAGRFFSHHDHAIVHFDSRHRVTKTKFEGGMMGELVEEVQPEDIFTSSDWPKRSYRHQLETVNGGDGVSVIEFDILQSTPVSFVAPHLNRRLRSQAIHDLNRGLGFHPEFRVSRCT